MSWFKSFWKKLTGPGPGIHVRNEHIETPTGSSTPFDETLSNFTPRAQQVLALARKEAERFNHNFLGPEHLLLGLIKLGQGVAVNVLRNEGVSLEIVRAEVEKQVGTGPDRKMIVNIPYTPRVKKAFDFARMEARALNHTYIGTEHLLLGLLREGNGVAARVLKNLDVDVEQTRREILKELDPNFMPTADKPGGSPSKTLSAQQKSALPLRVAPTQPQDEPVDISQRYDVYCTDRSQGVTAYHNVRFKGIKHLFQRSPYDTFSGYVELEQENGQTVFVARSSIIRFNEPEEAGQQE